VSRRLLRRELWNGNLEPPLWSIATDGDHIIRWAWRTHGRWPGRVAEVGERHPELPVVRLRDHTEVARWLAGPLAAVVADPRR
jgi:hypothetical protein